MTDTSDTVSLSQKIIQSRSNAWKNHRIAETSHEEPSGECDTDKGTFPLNSLTWIDRT